MNGGWNAADKRLIERGQPTLRRGIGYFMTLRGWYVERALVFVPEGKPDMVVDIQ